MAPASWQGSPHTAQQPAASWRHRGQAWWLRCPPTHTHTPTTHTRARRHARTHTHTELVSSCVGWPPSPPPTHGKSQQLYVDVGGWEVVCGGVAGLQHAPAGSRVCKHLCAPMGGGGRPWRQQGGGSSKQGCQQTYASAGGHQQTYPSAGVSAVDGQQPPTSPHPPAAPAGACPSSPAAAAGGRPTHPPFRPPDHQQQQRQQQRRRCRRRGQRLRPQGRLFHCCRHQGGQRRKEGRRGPWARPAPPWTRRCCGGRWCGVGGTGRSQLALRPGWPQAAGVRRGGGAGGGGAALVPGSGLRGQRGLGGEAGGAGGPLPRARACQWGLPRWKGRMRTPVGCGGGWHLGCEELGGKEGGWGGVQGASGHGCTAASHLPAIRAWGARVAAHTHPNSPRPAMPPSGPWFCCAGCELAACWRAVAEVGGQAGPGAGAGGPEACWRWQQAQTMGG